MIKAFQARIEIPKTDENPFRNGNQLIEGQDSNCIGSDSRPQLEIAHIYPKSLIIEELREIVNDQVQMAYLIKLLGNNICDVIIKLMQEKGYSFHDALTRVIYFHPDNVRIAPKGNIRKFDPDQCRTNREQEQLRISKLKISDFYLNDKIDYELIPPEWREEFSAKMIECHNIVERFKAIKKMKLPQPLYTKNLLTDRYIVNKYVDYKLYKQDYYGGDFYNNRKQFNVCTGEINWIPGKEPDLEFAEQTKRRGLNSFEQSPMMDISLPIYEYTMSGITKILALRSRIQTLARTGNVTILPNYYSFRREDNNISQIFLELRQRTETNVLVPLSLYDKHAVGVMFVAQGDGSGYKAFYLDPENTVIPEGLATIFKDNGYQIEQLPTEGQKYTNCGPEVIENFMLYLTGERLSQEDAIVNNSRLVEQELLSSSHDPEEASCLTLKDSYSKQDAVTVISNVAYDTQVSSDGYIIGNPTRYDIVTPQSIIDGLVVSADLGKESCDVLLELVHDYRINQDYAEAILGEIASIDIS
jgi:hypothetical protein